MARQAPVRHNTDMTAQAKPQMTYAEYLAQEERSESKHEFLRGGVWAMAGGTPMHSRLQGNCIAALNAALKGKPCGVYSSDLRVRIEATDRSTYPDVTVVCGKLQTATDDSDAVTNPVVIIEVLSDSSEASDRGEKFSHYRRLDSLQEYVLVNQKSKSVEVFRRSEGIAWAYFPFQEGQPVELKSIDVTLDITELYENPNG